MGNDTVQLAGDAIVQAKVPAQTVEINPHRNSPLPPTTTQQEDMMTAGQRRINLVWESTQAAVTILITLAQIYSAMTGKESKVLEFAFIAIISTYYARTNHTKVGGIGFNQAGR